MLLESHEVLKARGHRDGHKLAALFVQMCCAALSVL